MPHRSLSPSPERNSLGRRRLERRPEFLSNPERNNNLFTQFNSGLPGLENREHSNNGTIESNIHNIINSSFADNLAQAGSRELSSLPEAFRDLLRQYTSSSEAFSDRFRQYISNIKRFSDRFRQYTSNIKRFSDLARTEPSSDLARTEPSSDLVHQYTSSSEQFRDRLYIGQLRKRVAAEVQTENSGGTNSLTSFFSRIFSRAAERQTSTENSGHTGTPTEQSNQLSSASSDVSIQAQTEIINRSPETGKATITQVKERFNQSFKAHKAKISDTSRNIPPPETAQLLEQGLSLVQDSQRILTEPLDKLVLIDRRIRQILNMKVQDKIDAWKDAYPGAQEPESGSLYYNINVAKRDQIQLEFILHGLHQQKEMINLAVQDLAFYTFPIAEDYSNLRSHIQATYDDTVKWPFLHSISNIQKQLNIWDFNDYKEELFGKASSKIELVNTLIKEKKLEWRIAKFEYETELNRPAGHPFFLETGDMLDADAKIPVLLRDYLPGNGLVHMASTILNAHSLDGRDNLNQQLGIHPYGGGVSAKDLESRFNSLPNQPEYQFRKIEPQDLKTALSTGKPVGAFLDTSRVAVTSSGEGYYPERAVTLVRIERNDFTQQDEVVVIDELRTAHNHLWRIDPYRIRNDDELRIAPYRIPINIFAEQGWKNGGVFLPKAASEAIDQSQQSTQ